MAKIKDFLLQLESDDQLLDRWRKGKRNERKQLATDSGLDEPQATVIASNDLKRIRKTIEDESPGETFFCVVMVE